MCAGPYTYFLKSDNGKYKKEIVIISRRKAWRYCGERKHR